MHGFAQVPCPKCTTVAWVSPQVGYGICPSCHTQVRPGAAPASAFGAPQAAFAAPQAAGAGAAPMPAPYTLPSAGLSTGGMSMMRPALLVAGVLAIGAASVGFMMLKNKYFGSGKKDTASYVSLGLDPDRPDGDEMISSVEEQATRWKKDAHFWSVNYQAVRSDGSVDVSKGAEVQYVSPSRVTKSKKKDRQDSIRKFMFTASGADYSQQWDAINEWKNVAKPAAPECTVKDLAKKLQAEGLRGDKTVRVTFDPQFDWKDEQLWHVIGTDPQLDARFSMKTCERVEG